MEKVGIDSSELVPPFNIGVREMLLSYELSIFEGSELNNQDVMTEQEQSYQEGKATHLRKTGPLMLEVLDPDNSGSIRVFDFPKLPDYWIY